MTDHFWPDLHLWQCLGEERDGRRVVERVVELPQRAAIQGIGREPKSTSILAASSLLAR